MLTFCVRYNTLSNVNITDCCTRCRSLTDLYLHVSGLKPATDRATTTRRTGPWMLVLPRTSQWTTPGRPRICSVLSRFILLHFFISTSRFLFINVIKSVVKFCIIFDSCQHRLNASSCMKVLFTSNFSLSTFVFIPSFYYTLIIYLLFRYLIFYLFMF